MITPVIKEAELHALEEYLAHFDAIRKGIRDNPENNKSVSIDEEVPLATYRKLLDFGQQEYLRTTKDAKKQSPHSAKPLYVVRDMLISAEPERVVDAIASYRNRLREVIYHTPMEKMTLGDVIKLLPVLIEKLQ